MTFKSWSRTITNIKRNTALVIIPFIILSIIACFLFAEYRSFRKQTDALLSLQEEYRNYVIAVNRIMQDKQTTDKKKNESYGVAHFPKGARVFSSDDEDLDNSFVMVNRELEYLKNSTLGYIKKQNLSLLLDRIDNNIWKDYHDEIQQHSKSVVTNKKRKQRARRSRAATYAQDASVRTQEPKVRDFNFAWPIKRSEFWLSSFFGPRKLSNGQRSFHYGLDMAAVRGTPVYAAAAGVVVEARQAPGYGKTVVIAHNGKYKTRYAHLDKILTKTGRHVECGTLIGKVGATGNVHSSKRGRDASHLHFEVCVFGKQVNPMYFLTRDTRVANAIESTEE